MIVKNRRVTFLIGGEAGDGIFASGNILSKTFMHGGLHVFSTNEYISIIRGGHQWYSITVSESPVFSNRYKIDFLIALNREVPIIHIDRLEKKTSFIIIDERDKSERIVDFNIIPLPMYDILKKRNAKKVMRNSIALGALVGLVKYDISILERVYMNTYSEDIAEKNISLAKMGYNYVLEKYPHYLKKIFFSSNISRSQRIFCTGNEAIAIGAIASGLKFYAAYPMTPASSILHFLALLQKDLNIVVIQPESELAAINMIIGAAFAGVRSMTATSGGGFSLMTEALGFAAMAEIPVVIVVVQRPGPSTGMPTYTSQGDLRFVLHASQGEFPRIVLAPGDPYEAFEIAYYSFNLAWKYQLPVIILSDKFLAESGWSCDKFIPPFPIEEGKIIRDVYNGREKYKRYKITEDGVSPFAIPGVQNAIVKANSNEHDEEGSPTYDPALVNSMVDKRFKKQELLKREMLRYKTIKYYGDEYPEKIIVSWGSLKGPILEAINILGKNKKIGFLQVIWMEPFPRDLVKNILSKVGENDIMIIENNRTGLLNSLLNEYLHLDVKKKFLKYDGRPPYPYEIIKFLEG